MRENGGAGTGRPLPARRFGPGQIVRKDETHGQESSDQPAEIPPAQADRPRKGQRGRLPEDPAADPESRKGLRPGRGAGTGRRGMTRCRTMRCLPKGSRTSPPPSGRRAWTRTPSCPAISGRGTTPISPRGTTPGPRSRGWTPPASGSIWIGRGSECPSPPDPHEIRREL